MDYPGQGLRGVTYYDFGSTTQATRGHACHCIGCCPKCGQCRTTPWHAQTCDKIAALNAERVEVLREARRL